MGLSAPMRAWVVCVLAGAAAIGIGAEPGTRDMRLRGESAALAGDHASALEIWQKLVADRPNDVSLLLRLGVSQSVLGRYDEAEATFRKALRIQPSDPKLVFNLGLMYFRKGNEDQARELLNKTLAINPKFPEAHYHLGLLCEKQGQKAKAKRLYLRELDLNPSCSSAWERVFVMRGKTAKREISGSAALMFFAACMAVSGLLWIVILRRRQKARAALSAETWTSRTYSR